MLAVKLGSLQPKLPVKQHERVGGSGEGKGSVWMWEGRDRKGTKSEQEWKQKKQSQPKQTKPFHIPVLQSWERTVCWDWLGTRASVRGTEVLALVLPITSGGISGQALSCCYHVRTTEDTYCCPRHLLGLMRGWNYMEIYEPPPLKPEKVNNKCSMLSVLFQRMCIQHATSSSVSSLSQKI